MRYLLSQAANVSLTGRCEKARCQVQVKVTHVDDGKRANRSVRLLPSSADPLPLTPRAKPPHTDHVQTCLSLSAPMLFDALRTRWNPLI